MQKKGARRAKPREDYPHQSPPRRNQREKQKRQRAKTALSQSASDAPACSRQAPHRGAPRPRGHMRQPHSGRERNASTARCDRNQIEGNDGPWACVASPPPRSTDGKESWPFTAIPRKSLLSCAIHFYPAPVTSILRHSLLSCASPPTTNPICAWPRAHAQRTAPHRQPAAPPARSPAQSARSHSPSACQVASMQARGAAQGLCA